MVDPTVHRISVALATAVIYDHITTLDQEIELIWQRPKFSFVQFLFLVARYVGDFVPICMYSFSRAWGVLDSGWAGMRHMQIQAWSNLAVVWAMEGIMMFRISVMYRHSRRIVFWLLGAFTLEVASLVFIQVYASRSDTSIGTFSTRMRFCAPDYPADWYLLIWVPIITHEIFMLCFVVWKGIEYYSQRHAYETAEKARGTGSLMHVLFRDSIFFPLIALVICAANFLGWLTLPIGYSQIGVSISAFAARFLGCRLVLNLREVYYHPFEEEYTQGAPMPLVFLNTVETNIETRLQEDSDLHMGMS
ncbi:hypothetical protein CVT24_000999 [Panaeolus cyanescens]|uniref:DUF6533 domain-containing protein n=1 Tax=Panaeolus cyanescens TaxID=181874 RepID=A0A409YCH4_9AGAR|nr:hypothetical protein CVT24_000999 [Panaeolus cyanescens]